MLSVGKSLAHLLELWRTVWLTLFIRSSRSRFKRLWWARKIARRFLITSRSPISPAQPFGRLRCKHNIRELRRREAKRPLPARPTSMLVPNVGFSIGSGHQFTGGKSLLVTESGLYNRGNYDEKAAPKHWRADGQGRR